MTWWTGTRLVARRMLLENFRSRVFRVVTGILLLISLAAVVVPQLIDDGPTTYTLATVDEAPSDLRSTLTATAESADFEVEYATYPDEDAIRTALRDGDATVGLVGDTMFTASDADPTFPALVTQTLVALKTTVRLESLGLTSEEVQSVQSVQPPTQVTVGRVDDEPRSWVGFVVGIALYVALTFSGSAIANAVAMEKSSRISEVLLAVLRPSQILVGTVLAAGLTTLAQLLVLLTPPAVAVPLTDSIGLPAVAGGDLALAVVWFALGFALYAFLFAGTAALVDKVTEAASAVLPVTMVLVIGYMLGVTVVSAEPTSSWSALISMFPLTAPLAMPIRWATGEVPVYQLVTAMALTVGAAVLLMLAGSSLYRRALLITGRRVKLSELLRRRQAS